MGAAAVVMVGGAMGLYFRPDLGEEPARGGPVGAPPEPASGEGVDILVAEAPPGPVVAAAVAIAPLPMDVSYDEIADAAVGGLPAPAAPVYAPPPVRVVTPPPTSGPFAAARRSFDRMMSSRDSEPDRPTPARRVVEPSRSVERPMMVARNDAPAPAPTPAVLRERPAEPLVIARADPPRAVPAREPAERDCDRLRGAGARIVCERPELTTLDRRLSAEFERAVAAGHDRAALSLDQDSWLAKREAAAPDPRAVAEAYERRIRQLRSMQ
jgi:uncharacterized protein YecT (DUF1311 family)